MDEKNPRDTDHRVGTDQNPFRVGTDEGGREYMIHEGTNRASRRRAKAEQGKRFRAAMAKIKKAQARILKSGEFPNFTNSFVSDPEPGHEATVVQGTQPACICWGEPWCEHVEG